jgi:radical SAM-linked protein
MRRANLPLAYSQGYNPRPKITLASALPLGYTSDFELVDFWLEKDLALDDVNGALEKALPPGIIITDLATIENTIPKLQTQTLSSTFQVSIFDWTPDLEKTVKKTLLADEIILEKFRKGKLRRKNLRETIIKLIIIEPNSLGQQRLEMVLQAEEGKTGRPDNLLEKMGIDPLATKVNRINIQLK